MKRTARELRARVAALTRHRPDDPETLELAREFKADRLAEYIERTVNAAPRLTPDQVEEIATQLRRSVR